MTDAIATLTIRESREQRQRRTRGKRQRGCFANRNTDDRAHIFLLRLLIPDLLDSEINLVSLSNIMSALDFVRHNILCNVESFTVLRLKLLTFCALNVILGKLLSDLICLLLFSVNYMKRLFIFAT